MNWRERKNNSYTVAVMITVIMALSACAERTRPAPVVNLETNSSSRQAQTPIQDKTYKVKKGETLYSIAFRAGTDVRTLAQYNNLKPPYQIYPNQTLHLIAQASINNGSTNASKSIVKTVQKNSKKTVANDKAEEYGEVKGGKFTAVKVPSLKQKVNRWIWPVKGPVISNFSSAEKGNQGIDIAGKKGQPVKAAADGLIVYSGSALRGYGNLIIIKHNDDYLSAYAHNDELLVKEQETVKAGSVIARMGNTGTDRTMLHFEIRFRGKSVNPMRYLPK